MDLIILTVYVIFLIPLSIAVANAAKHKGHSGLGYFIVSLFVSPILMALVVAALPDLKLRSINREILQLLASQGKAPDFDDRGWEKEPDSEENL